jgi:diaminopimelate epimerase
MRVKFHKYSGAGNDFILISREENPRLELTPALIRRICERRLNIGADGVLFLKKSREFDFALDYFNADGTGGSLCGNGARCAVHFAVTSRMATRNRVRFWAANKIYEGELLETNKVKVRLNPPRKIDLNINLKLDDYELKCSFADTGSPHLIVSVDENKAFPDLLPEKFWDENFPVSTLGRKLRYHEAFAPEGTNVNFIRLRNGVVEIRTYERGVENETLACGTGAVASAVVAHLRLGVQSPITVLPKSGLKLKVVFDYIKKAFSNIYLIGPAEEVFEGYFNYEIEER